MSNLGIDDNLIGSTQCFLTNRWMELVIDRHINFKCQIETEISQGSPVLPILFLIYIGEVYLEIESCLL